MDHVRAVVIDFSADTAVTQVLSASDETPQLHRKSGPPGSGHLPTDTAFFDDIVNALGDATEIVVAGPGTAKRAFVRYVAVHQPALSRRIVGVETLNHPTPGQLQAWARRWFRRTDALIRNDPGDRRAS